MPLSAGTKDIVLPYILTINGTQTHDIQLIIINFSTIKSISLPTLISGLTKLKLDTNVTELNRLFPSQSWISPEELIELGYKIQADHTRRIVTIRNPSNLKQVRPLSLDPGGQSLRPMLKDSQLSFWINSELSQTINSQQKNLTLNPVINWNNWIVQSQVNQDLYLSKTNLEFLNVSQNFYKDHFQISAGDLAYPMISNQTFIPLVGVGITKGYPIAIFGEQESEIFSKQIQVLSPSLLTVFVNQQQVYSENLQAGTYSLSQLPIGYGYNQIEIRILDAFGQETKIESAYFAGSGLVPANDQYYTVNIGEIGTTQQLASPVGLSGNYGYSFNYKHGYTDSWTLGIFGQSDPQQKIAGFSSFWGLSQGVFSNTFGTIDAGGFPKMLFDTVQFDSYALPSETLIQRISFGLTTTQSHRSTNLQSIYTTAQWARNALFGNITLRYANNPIRAQYSTEVTCSITKILNQNFRGTLELGVNDSRILNREWRTVLGFTWTDSSTRVNYRNNTRNGQQSAQVSVKTAKDWTQEAGFQQQSSTQSLNYTSIYAPEINNQFFVNYAKVSAPSFSQSGGTIRYITPMSELNSVYTNINNTPSGIIRLRSSLLYADGFFGISRPIQSNFILIGSSQGTPIENVQSNLKTYPTAFGNTMMLNILPNRITPIHFVDTGNELGSQYKNKDISILPRLHKGYKIELEKENLFIVSGRLLKPEGIPIINTFGEFTQTDKKAEPILFRSDEEGSFQTMELPPGKYRLRFPYNNAYASSEINITPHSEHIYSIGNIVIQPVSQ